MFILFLFFVPSYTFAGGFQVNLQGQKQTGMGHTGTGLFLDASSILFNPGALSFLERNSFIVGGSFIFPSIAYLEPYPGIYTAELVPQVGTPFAIYSSFKTNTESKFTYGLGIYTPFGSSAKWEDDWKGQFLVREINLKAIFIQPTISFKVTDNIGIGAGFIYATGAFGLRKGIPIENASGAYGEAELSGKAAGYGYNAGILFKATEKLSIGLDYRSAVKVAIDNGAATFSVPDAVKEFFPNTSFTTSITLPSVSTLGIGYQLSEKTLLAVDINFIGWSSYDTLSFDFEENTDKLADVASPRAYEDVFIFRIGAQHALNEKAAVRLGSYYDMSPVQSGYLTPETPDADKLGVTAGVTYQFTENFKLDLSFLFIEGKKRTDTNLETDFGGTYKSRAFIPGIGLDFCF